jgi:AraC-like DNA-binding protein
MSSDRELLQRLYDHFNARNMEAALATMYTDVRSPVPVMHYVARWRMNVALTWLKADNVPLAEVAGRLGYESEAAFRRTFKRVTGFSPGAVRRRAATSSGSNW